MELKQSKTQDSPLKIYWNTSSFSFSNFLIWNGDDVHKLRSKYRIIGGLIGTNISTPEKLTLPLLLSKEEVFLLIEKGWGKIYKLLDLEPPSKEEIIKFEEKRKSDAIFQKEQMLGKSITEIKDIELKKLEGTETIKIPFVGHLRDSPLQDEIEITEEWKNQFFQNSSSLEYQKCLIFRDLWEKGFFVSSKGLKFGGDFLVYESDPFTVHSKYIVLIVPFSSSSLETSVSPLDLISKQRVASSTNKSLLLASVDVHQTPHQFKYLCLNQ